MIELLGSLGSLFVVVMWMALVGLGFCLPLIFWSVTRNIRGIRVQLERLNDTLESRPPTEPARSTAATFAPAPANDNRAANARPGALGI